MSPDAAEQDVTEVYACFDRSSQRRRFMTTQGGYLGWAPDNTRGGPGEQTRVGDVLVVVWGRATPLVVRPCGGGIRCLGRRMCMDLWMGRRGGMRLRRSRFASWLVGGKRRMRTSWTQSPLSIPQDSPFSHRDKTRSPRKYILFW